MPPKYSYAVFGASVCLIGGALALLRGTSGLLDGLALLLFWVSPMLLFALAALVAKRNVVVRISVVLGCLFLAINFFALVGGLATNASTSAIGFSALVILQLLVAAPLLIAGLLAGRVRWGRESNGIVEPPRREQSSAFTRESHADTLGTTHRATLRAVAPNSSPVSSRASVNSMTNFARITLVLYVPLIILAAAAALGGGMLGFVITALVGLPWSVIIASLLVGRSFENTFGQHADAVLTWIFWWCSWVNVWLLARWPLLKRRLIDRPRP